MNHQQSIEKLKLDLQLRGYSNGTVTDYSEMVDLFLKYIKKPTEELGEQEIREYLYYLRNDRNLSPSTVNGCNSALRFFFEITLEKSLIYRRIPRLKDPIVLPSILTRYEVEAIINVTENIRHKCILMTIYGSGLRLSEVAALKISDIDSKNMRIFVEQGKGKKDRYVLLSQSNLETLREYWKEYKPKYWLFEGREKGSRISTRAIHDAFKKSLKKAGINKKASVHTVRHYVYCNIMVSDIEKHEKIKLSLITHHNIYPSNISYTGFEANASDLHFIPTLAFLQYLNQRKHFQLPFFSFQNQPTVNLGYYNIRMSRESL